MNAMSAKTKPIKETADAVRARLTAASLPPQAAPARPVVAALPVGARVRVTKGAWAGCVGAIHKLTTSVGGGRTSIVHVDPPATGEKDARFIPRSRLVVVENEHLEPAPARTRQKG